TWRHGRGATPRSTASSAIPTPGGSTPRSPIPSASATSARHPPSARWATVTTTRWRNRSWDCTKPNYTATPPRSVPTAAPGKGSTISRPPSAPGSYGSTRSGSPESLTTAPRPSLKPTTVIGLSLMRHERSKPTSLHQTQADSCSQAVGEVPSGKLRVQAARVEVEVGLEDHVVGGVLHPGQHVGDVEGVVAQPVSVGADDVSPFVEGERLALGGGELMGCGEFGQDGVVPGGGRRLGADPALVVGVEADDVDVGVARVGQGHVVARGGEGVSVGVPDEPEVGPGDRAHGGHDLVEVGGEVGLGRGRPGVPGHPVAVELPT